MAELKKDFAKYVSLNILSMVGLSCYILADTFFISRGVGPDGLAALNIALPAFTVMNSVGLLLGMGGATCFSLGGGQKNAQNREIFTQMAWAAAIFSLICMLVGAFGAVPLSRFLGADIELLDLTSTYVRVILLFTPLFVFNNLLNAFVRNDGAPRLAMVAMLLGCLINIILDYVFIFPCGLGMLGAVLATCIAPALGIALLSLHYVSPRSNFALHRQKPHLGLICRYLRPGGFAFVTELCSGLVIFAFNLLILNIAGNIGVSAYGVITNIAYVVLFVINGVVNGSQPLISAHFGRGEHKKAVTLFRYALGTALALTLVIYLFSVWQNNWLVSIFNNENDATLQLLAEEGVIIYFAGFIVAAVNMVAAGYFGAIGHSPPSFVIGLARGLVVIVPAAAALSAVWDMHGIWCSFLVSELIVLGGVLIYYLVHKQKKRDRK